jgi:patatin-related protein
VLDEPKLQLEKEIRFALVMYGGVSLAVYINGVAQEFYRLVRATADDKGKLLDISPGEAIYREIAQILSASGVNEDFDENSEIDHNSPIRTRFVVDILSGTSAGGLNSLFLAKALANGQDFSVLQDLWTNQADIATLLNDGRSTINPPGGFGLVKQNPPQSLLNSERMYALLLGALDAMDAVPPQQTPVLADEVDLFITTTDLRGIKVQVQLADKVVPERRFRSVFHFRRSPLLPKLEPPGEAGEPEELKPPRNDFESKFNPFLAFTGRCTSAFPIAFEPMRLRDIEPVLERSSAWGKKPRSSQDWQPFLVDYVEEDGPFNGDQSKFSSRAFADGGYLNNKPFSYAIEELGIRGGDLPYERKLVYIEPSPERINPEPAAVDKPDLIENSLDAAFTLPRYQTIREDLASVSTRNHLVRKIRSIVEELETDIDSDPSLLAAWLPISSELYACTPLSKFVKARGALYAAYHRLKVKAVTQDIARFLISALALDDSSDNLRAAEYLVWAWRERAYTAEETAAPELESCFLSRFDLSYRERRMYFVLGRLDALYALGKDAERVVTAAGLTEQEVDAQRKRADDFKAEIRSLRGHRTLRDRPGLVNILSNLRLCRNRWLERGEANPLHTLLTPEIRNKWKLSLQAVLEMSTENCLTAARHQLYDNPNPKPECDLLKNLQALMNRMAEENAVYFRTSAHWAEELFPSGSQELLKHCVRYFYDRYDFYDAATFPITYGTDVGILKTADVYRISPVDAVEIINEIEDPKRRKKLAGDSLSAFGAFFKDTWRHNDIMWGRLDGAERIITILLPGDRNAALRKKFIDRAHRTIIADTLQKFKVKELQKAFVDQLANASPIYDQQAAKSAALALLGPKELLDFLKTSYSVDRTYEPAWALPIAARTASIIGRLLTFLCEERHWQIPAITMAARLSRFVWAIVQVAIPGSIAYASFAWFAGLLLFNELILLAVGLWLRSQVLCEFASTALAVTLIAGILVQLLHGYMHNEKRLFRVLQALFFIATISVGIAIAVVGIHDIPVWLARAPEMLQKFQQHGPGLRSVLGASSAAAIVFASLCQFPRFSQASRRSVPPDLQTPILGMELASSKTEIYGILSTSLDRRSMRRVQFADFGLILAYASFFTTLAVYEYSRLDAWRFLPVLAACSAWFTATFDYRENVSILQTLDIPACGMVDAQVRNTRRLSLTKWTSLAVTLLLLAPGLILQLKTIPVVGGVVCALAGLTGFVGVFNHRWLRESTALFACLVLGVLAMCLISGSI